MTRAARRTWLLRRFAAALWRSQHGRRRRPLVTPGMIWGPHATLHEALAGHFLREVLRLEGLAVAEPATVPG